VLHTVRAGESPASIAAAYGVDGGALLLANPQKPLVRLRRGEHTWSSLFEGEAIHVPNGAGTMGDAASDAASLGVSISSDGSAHWDPSHVVSNLPPSAQGAITAANDAIQGNNQAAFDTAINTASAALVGVVPYGTIAAGALQLFKGIFEAAAPPPAVTYYDWEHLYGSYDPGPFGSFENYANKLIRGVFDSTFAAGKGGSLGQTEALLGVTLADAINGWNATHANSSTKQIVVHGAYPSGWGGPSFASGPIGVAANGILRSAGGPHDTDFKFTVNTGPAHPPLAITPRMITPAQAPPSPSSGASTALVVGGGLATALAALWLALGRPVTMEAIKAAFAHVGK